MNKSISHTMFTNFTPALILHSPSGSEFSAGRLCPLGIFPRFSLFTEDFPQVHQVDTCQGSTGWNPSQSTQSANCWQSTEASRSNGYYPPHAKSRICIGINNAHKRFFPFQHLVSSSLCITIFGNNNKAMYDIFFGTLTNIGKDI